MTPGFLVAFGGVLVFGFIASAVIFFMTRTQHRIPATAGDFREAEINASLAEAEVAARRAAAEIAKVRASMAH